MRILIDGRLYGLENAGLGRYTINLIDGLQKTDHKNQYFVLLRKKYFDRLNFTENWKKVLADFKHYSLIEQIRLPGVISSYKPDLVHFLHFNIPIFYRGKFVVTIHDLLMQKHRGARATTLPIYFYYPKQIAAKYAFKKAVAGAAKIIVPSKAVKDEIVSYYKLDKDKMTVTYEGVDEKILEETDSDKLLQKYGLAKPYFIYTGNAYPHKNLERAIEAIVSIKEKRGRRVIFALVSSRDIFTRKLEIMISGLRAGESVKILGFVPDGELGGLYRNAVGFLYPSLSEGFGLPGLEALAAGTLTLASDIPVFKEVYKDAAIYFNPWDFSSIVKTVEEALDMDSQKRASLIEYGQKFVKRYSWSKMAKETLEVYESCLSL